VSAWLGRRVSSSSPLESARNVQIFASTALKKILNIKEKNVTLHKNLSLKNLIQIYEFDYIEEYFMYLL